MRGKGNCGKICRARQSVPAARTPAIALMIVRCREFPFRRNGFGAPWRDACALARELLLCPQHRQGTCPMDTSGISSLAAQHPLQRLHATPVIPTQQLTTGAGLPASPIEPASAVKIGQAMAQSGRGHLLNKIV